MKNYKLFLSWIIGIIAGILLFVMQPSDEVSYTKIKKDFARAEQQLDNELKQFIVNYNSNKKPFSSQIFHFHVFKGDKLVYWSDNKMPINQVSDLHFPTEGIVQLQNGWYFTKIIKKEGYLFTGSMLIEQTYPFTNNYLVNGVNTSFFDSNWKISTEAGNTAIQITSNDTLQVIKSFNNNKLDTIHLWVFLFVLIWSIVHFYHIQQSNPWLNGLFLALYALLLLGIYFYFSRYYASEIYDPSVLGLNSWIPNLAALCCWFTLFMGILITLKSVPFSYFTKLVLTLCFPSLIVLYYVFIERLVANSSIPFEVYSYFNLTVPSYLLLGILIVLGFTVVWLYKQAILSIKWKQKLILYSLGLALTIVFFFDSINTYSILTCIIIIIADFFHQGHRYKIISKEFIQYGFLIIGSSVLFWSIYENEKKREYSDCQVYANQLLNQQDLNTEINYAQLSKKLVHDDYLKRIAQSTFTPSSLDLKLALERKLFLGFWDRYEIDFYYKKNDSIGNILGFDRIATLIKSIGTKSDLASNLYTLRTNTEHYSYAFSECFQLGNSKIELVGGLKAKTYPTLIRLPRLLQSENTQLLNQLERYSLAFYSNGVLVNSFGSCNYPVRNQRLSQQLTSDYKHIVKSKEDGDAVYLSRLKTTPLQFVTGTSFLAVLLLICWIVYRLLLGKTSTKNSFNLSVKVQVVIIGLTVVAMGMLSLGSTNYIQQNYTSKYAEILEEKLRTIAAMPFFQQQNTQNYYASIGTNELDETLYSISKVFGINISIYDEKGMLIGSSQPKLFNKGILSEQLNVAAFNALKTGKNSFYLHTEQIGALKYTSAYKPLIRANGTLIAILNLPLLDEQNTVEIQSEEYLSAIVNVFFILVLVGILLSILLANWLTKPLDLIRKSFETITLSEKNEKIAYSGNDEIGLLVGAYNEKIEELERMVIQLAQNEREAAWREMAKQVAHEIKNPITPIKLTLQHLQRTFNPTDSNAKERIDKISNSIIEQIDTLTRIANTFSTFSMMPQPKMERIEIYSLIESVSSIYSGEIEIQIQRAEKEYFVDMDKDMGLRIYMNLITNAIQARHANRSIQLNIKIYEEDDNYVTELEDNGKGMDATTLKHIFEPYFTTKSTGTGLGLAMIKQLIAVHKGEILVAHTSEKGTTFVIKWKKGNL